jgi:hypothetical protein
MEMSQLELATFTYVLCALIAYGFYWSKPQGVEQAIKHYAPTDGSSRPVTYQDLHYLIHYFGGTPILRRNFVPPFGMDAQPVHPKNHIPTDTSLTAFAWLGIGGENILFDDSDFAGVVIGMGFGGLYCLGWNHPFPSMLEAWAWRLSAIIITGSLIPYSVANALCTWRYIKSFRSPGAQRTHIAHILILYILLPLYIACRVFMLIEMFRTLFMAPQQQDPTSN